MPSPDKQLSAEQSRQVAETIREEIARRRISRQSLAEQAKLSLSTLEKVLGGRRPFTIATTVRLEQALGVSLRKAHEPLPPAPAPRVQPRKRKKDTCLVFSVVAETTNTPSSLERLPLVVIEFFLKKQRKKCARDVTIQDDCCFPQ